MFKYAKLIGLHSLPLLLGIVLSYYLWRQNAVLLTIFILVSLGVILIGKDSPVETKIFIYGMAVGFVIETLGTQWSGYQKFLNPDVGGIPFWLLVAWGYGFILMKRIGLIIGTGSPWVRK